jgi:alkylhydroperoxidase family enzyme
MSTLTHVPNVPQISNDAADPGMREVIERSKVTKSPPPAWYRTMGQNPEVAKEFARYWDMLHRGGTVPHEIKELARIQIAQIIGCEFCARQISPLASSITQEEKMSCALPNWERDKEVYEELRKFYSNAEIIELSAFFCLTAGGNRMAKSWSIEAHGEVSSIPKGAMSIHGTQPAPV